MIITVPFVNVVYHTHWFACGMFDHPCVPGINLAWSVGAGAGEEESNKGELGQL